MVQTRAMKQRVDYISALPDVILLHILSFLPMSDCIVLSFVSKRWKNLLTQISSLNLSELEIISTIISRTDKCPSCRALPSVNSTTCRMHIVDAARKKFSDTVDRILLLHCGCTIDKFRLSMKYETAWQAKVDTWIKLAFTSDIKEIELCFYDRKVVAFLERQGYQRRYPVAQNEINGLPYHHVSPRLLNGLSLYGCRFKVSGFKRFEVLRRLALNFVILLDSSLAMVASTCPVLEDLHLKHCMINRDFLVSKVDLMIKHLFIDGCKLNQTPIQIDISTPHLESLTVEDCFITTSHIRKATKPLHVKLHVKTRSRVNESDIILASFFEGLQSCRTLSLTSWTIQALPAEGTIIQKSMVHFPHLTDLHLEVGLVKQELPKIIDLLKRCKNLELLNIEVNKTLSLVEQNNPDHANQVDVDPGFDEDNFWQSHDWPYSWPQKHLKKVTVTRFTGTKHEMNLLRFILAKADVLERISVSYIMEDNGQSLLEQDVIRELMWFDRASPVAQLWVSPHPLI